MLPVQSSFPLYCQNNIIMLIINIITRTCCCPDCLPPAESRGPGPSLPGLSCWTVCWAGTGRQYSSLVLLLALSTTPLSTPFNPTCCSAEQSQDMEPDWWQLVPEAANNVHQHQCELLLLVLRECSSTVAVFCYAFC